MFSVLDVPIRFRVNDGINDPTRCKRKEATAVCSEEISQRNGCPFPGVVFISTKCNEAIEMEDEMFLIPN